METVGFIGLGNMGGGMSANIQRAGYPMIVYDLREEAALPLLEGGARLANSPSEVGRRQRHYLHFPARPLRGGGRVHRRRGCAGRHPARQRVH